MPKIAYILGATLALLLVGGKTQPSLARTGVHTVTIPGSGDSQELLRELAHSYTAQYLHRRVVVPNSTDSSGAVAAVGSGASPIGRVSRLPTVKEHRRYGDFKYLEFARVPIAIVVSRDAGVSDLSEQQICDIYAGNVTRWKQIGGANIDIAVQDRPAGGSSLQSLRNKLACFAKLQITPSARFNERNVDLVSAMGNQSGAIGFMPLREARLHGFKTVTIGHIAPDQDHYKLVTGLGFVYKKPWPAEIAAFIDYLSTEPAHQVIQEAGLTPATHREIVVRTR